jgi:organic radical activating enzyme
VLPPALEVPGVKLERCVGQRFQTFGKFIASRAVNGHGAVFHLLAPESLAGSSLYQLALGAIFPSMAELSNSSWCPLPWKGINIRNNGDFRVCCNANVSFNQGLLRDPQGLPFNAKDADLNQLRNSPLLNDIRQQMLSGQRHPTCQRCNVEDDTGLDSRRSFERKNWQTEFSLAEAQRLTNPDGTIPTEAVSIGYMDVRFGNLCNLKCRMCGPTDSSAWYKEHFESVGERFTESSGKVTLERRSGRVQVVGEDPYNWHAQEHFWLQLEANLKGIRKIYCVGGEPLMIERHYGLLNKLIADGLAGGVNLEYNSNVTTIPERAFELWRHFKSVSIGASIDGFAEINDYIRYPSRWSQIEKNLIRLDQSLPNLRVWLSTTVQTYNIFYLPELLQWKIKANFSRIGANASAPFIKTHPLHSPKYFSIQVLPMAAKLAVARKLDGFYENWFLSEVGSIEARFGTRQTLQAKMKRILDGYKALMFKQDLSHLLPEFIAATERMDKFRNQSWSETMPELAHLVYAHV